MRNDVRNIEQAIKEKLELISVLSPQERGKEIEELKQEILACFDDVDYSRIEGSKETATKSKEEIRKYLDELIDIDDSSRFVHTLKTTTEQVAIRLAWLVACYGYEVIKAEILNKIKPDEARLRTSLNDYRQSQNDFFNSAKERNLPKKEEKDLESALAKFENFVQDTKELQKIQTRDKKYISVEDFKNFISEYGFNFLNQWKIEFIMSENKRHNFSINAYDLQLLTMYAKEFSEGMSSIEYETTYFAGIKNFSLSNWSEDNFGVTFWLDDKMRIYDLLLILKNAQFNSKNGAIKFLDSFSFDKVIVTIYNAYHNPVFGIEYSKAFPIFNDNIRLKLDRNKKELKSFDVGFNYKSVKYFRISGLNKIKIEIDNSAFENGRRKRKLNL